MTIHPTAQVDAGAHLADGVEIGAWSIVGPGVMLAEGVRVASHVVIQQDTTVGDRGLFMTGAHVGHDCVVGSDVTFANNATLGGHARIGDRVFLGGLSAVHQFGRVGQGAIVGGLSAVTRDVIPYGSAWGNHVRLHGLNLIGLKRKGYGKAEVRRLLAAYRDIFEAPGLFSERLDAAQATYADLPEIQEIVAFIREDTRRPVALPGE